MSTPTLGSPCSIPGDKNSNLICSRTNANSDIYSWKGGPGYRLIYSSGDPNNVSGCANGTAVLSMGSNLRPSFVCNFTNVDSKFNQVDK